MKTVNRCLSYVAGGVSMGCCFGGRVMRRVGTSHFTWRFCHQESTPGTRIPPALQANRCFFFYVSGVALCVNRFRELCPLISGSFVYNIIMYLLERAM